MTIIGAGAATTSIERAASAPAFRLLQVAATGTLTLQGLTLRGGDRVSSGGIYNLGTVTLTNCTLTHNTASLSGGGGGISSTGTLTLTNSTLAYNTAGRGGGIETASAAASVAP